jgi:hypothetical protein
LAIRNATVRILACASFLSVRAGSARPWPGSPPRRPFAELVVADYDLARAQRAAAARALMNAADPRFVMPLFRAALQAGKLALAGMGAEPGR